MPPDRPRLYIFIQKSPNGEFITLCRPGIDTDPKCFSDPLEELTALSQTPKMDFKARYFERVRYREEWTVEGRRSREGQEGGKNGRTYLQEYFSSTELGQLPSLLYVCVLLMTVYVCDVIRRRVGMTSR